MEGGIKRTVFVSFPRSGHHMMINALKAILKDQMKYCEYYGHCMKFPCTDVSTNVMKNHDFDLKVPYLDDINYFVQLRHPYFSIQSWYEFYDAEYLNYTYDQFLDEKLEFWIRFVKKWIAFEKKINFIVYEKITKNFKEDFINILKRMNAQAFLEQDIDDVSNRILPVRLLTLSENFSLKRLKFVEDKIGDKLEYLGIPLFYEEAEKEMKLLRNNPLTEIYRTYRFRQGKHVKFKNLVIKEKEEEISKLKEQLNSIRKQGA